MRRILVLAVLFCLVPATPAVAQPALTLAKPCFVSAGSRGEPVGLDASGFPPLSTIDFAVNGAYQTSAQSDAFGNVAGPGITAPVQPSGIGTFTVTATAHDAPTHTASATARVAALAVTLTPGRARPSQRVLFTGQGFTRRRPVFAHYVFGGRVRQTVLLARPHGSCGTFAARARQIPVRRPRTGLWRVQLDQRREYRREQPPYVLLSITVAKVPRSQ